MGNELVATYRINGKKFSIFGCWDNDTPENEFDFYDVYDEDGTCLNEGCMFQCMPSREQLAEYLEQEFKYPLNRKG